MSKKVKLLVGGIIGLVILVIAAYCTLPSFTSYHSYASFRDGEGIYGEYHEFNSKNLDPYKLKQLLEVKGWKITVFNKVIYKEELVTNPLATRTIIGAERQPRILFFRSKVQLDIKEYSSETKLISIYLYFERGTKKQNYSNYKEVTELLNEEMNLGLKAISFSDFPYIFDTI